MPSENPQAESRPDAVSTRRDLLQQLSKAAYVAPVTMLLLSSKDAAAY